jgi:hypothetical protein
MARRLLSARDMTTRRTSFSLTALFALFSVTTLSSVGCAAPVAQDSASAQGETGETTEGMYICTLPQLSPSVTGTLGVPAPHYNGVNPGVPVQGTAPVGYQTTNCSGAYEIEAWMPVEPATTPVPEHVVFLANLAKILPARSDCTTALHMTWGVAGLQNGTWVTLTQGAPTADGGVNFCEVQGFFDLPLATAENYSAFRVEAKAYVKNGTSITYLPVSLEVQQDPTH